MRKARRAVMIVDTIVGEAEEAEALGEYLAIKMKEEA